MSRNKNKHASYKQPFIEPLESRTLLSAAMVGNTARYPGPPAPAPAATESASAQLTLVSTTGSAADPIFNYDITLTNTGTTDLGTFWFAWVPGQNFLPSVPTDPRSPAGWGNVNGTSSTPLITGAGNSFDGSAIQWVAKSNASLTPGQSLAGFDFSSADSPAVLAGQSPSHPNKAVLDSFVYQGQPETDPGFEFLVTAAPAVTPAASTTTLATSAASITAGDSVTFTATVAPATPGSAVPTGSVKFMDGSTTLGSAALKTDGTAVFSTASLSAGTHTIIAQYQGDTAYAVSTSQPITQTVTTAPPVQTATGLQPGLGGATLPVSTIAGEKLNLTVPVTLTNLSQSTVKGKTTITLFASTTQALTGTQTKLISIAKHISIKSSDAATVKIRLSKLPADLANGNYFLIASATDPAGQTLSTSSASTFAVAPPAVAFSSQIQTSQFPSTIAAGAKTRAKAVLSISNTGNVAATGSSAIALYLSSDQTLASGTLIRTVTVRTSIKPGKTKRATIQLKKIPAVPSAGDYFLLAQITDPRQHETTVVNSSTLQITV